MALCGFFLLFCWCRDKRQSIFWRRVILLPRIFFAVFRILSWHLDDSRRDAWRRWPTSCRMARWGSSSLFGFCWRWDERCRDARRRVKWRRDVRLHLFGIFSRRRDYRYRDALRWFSSFLSYGVPMLVFALFGLCRRGDGGRWLGIVLYGVPRLIFPLFWILFRRQDNRRYDVWLRISGVVLHGVSRLFTLFGILTWRRDARLPSCRATSWGSTSLHSGLCQPRVDRRRDARRSVSVMYGVRLCCGGLG